MSPRARLAAGIAATFLLSSCAAGHEVIEPPGQPQDLSGAAVTFVLDGRHFALAAFAPPASMVLVETGPLFFWVTPSSAIRYLFLQDVVAGRPAGTHVLRINAGGTADYEYTLSWDH
ncbi:MAG TPA: hypothetical protein VFD49_21735 [Candidatus Dormibacteraeota bacterium]|nr:hypothetical protein [Candidatus Dormibacteraeota bacterium]